MEVILNYINKYKEIFIKENASKIKLIESMLKKLRITESSFKGIRILLNEKPYEFSISKKTGLIRRPSIGVFTDFHINGILLFYTMLGSIAFLTNNFTPTCSLQRVLTLLCGDVKKGQELLMFLNHNKDEITPLFFGEYLFYFHNVLLINRFNFVGVELNQLKNIYQKKYFNNDKFIIDFINELISYNIEAKIIVMNLSSSFYQENENLFTSLTKVFIGNIISPLTVNQDITSYYQTWYLLNDEMIKIHNNKLCFNDFLLNI